MSDSGDSVLVVGAGIVGIACAHYLSQLGLQVTVVDQGRVGGGCSHGNCGHLCASHVLPLTDPDNLRAGLRSLFDPAAPFRVKPQWRLSMLTWLWRFARRCNRRAMLEAGHHTKSVLDSSAVEYERLFAATGIDAQWKRRGLLYVLSTRRGMDAFAAQDEMLRDEYGVAARRIEGADLTEFEPALREGLAGAYHYADDASIRPDTLTANWSKWLTAEGVRFEENRRVRSVRSMGDRVAAVVTDADEMTADHYVFATGAWSAHLAADLDCPIPVEPAKGYSMTMPRPGNVPRHPMVFSEHRVAATPFDDGFRLGSMMEFAGFDTSVPPRRIRQLADSAGHYFRELKELKEPTGHPVHETWYGWRPLTWDSLPIIGRLPRRHNAVLATGHHMLGMTMAPATGRLVAELIGEQRPHIDPTPFSPTRFP